MTLHTFTGSIKLSASSNFQVLGCNNFQNLHCFHLYHAKAYVSKIGIALKQVKVIPGSSFYQTMMSWSHRCYISSFVEIGPPVLEKKIFEEFLPYMGVAPSWSCDQDMAIKISMPLPKEAPHKIFQFDRPSGFREEDL